MAINIFAPTHDFLVYVRAGDDSLHPSWLEDDPDRNWDCLVSYYGSGPISAVVGDGVVAGGFGKLDSFKTLYEDNREFFAQYKAVWVADPDLEALPGDLSRMFLIADEYGLDISQPALTPDSFWSFFHTVRHPAYLFRKTNFVEVMCPLFSRAALPAMVHWFDLNKSSWGIDLCWSQAARGRFTLAIIDAVAVRHAKAIDLTGGAWYLKVRAAGSNPWDDLENAEMAAGSGARWLRPRSCFWASVPAPGISRLGAYIATQLTTARQRVRQLIRWCRAKAFGARKFFPDA